MLQGLEEEGRDADDRHGTEETTPRIHLSLHKCLVEGDGHTHIEAVGLMGDDVNNMKCMLDALKGHYKLRSNEIVAATSYKQIIQADLGLPEYIEKCKEVTAACNFGTSYYKCL